MKTEQEIRLELKKQEDELTLEYCEKELDHAYIDWLEAYIAGLKFSLNDQIKPRFKPIDQIVNEALANKDINNTQLALIPEKPTTETPKKIMSVNIGSNDRKDGHQCTIINCGKYGLYTVRGLDYCREHFDKLFGSKKSSPILDRWHQNTQSIVNNNHQVIDTQVVNEKEIKIGEVNYPYLSK